MAKPLVNDYSTLINSLLILPMIDGRKVLKIHEICNFQLYLKIILPIKITYTYFNLLPTKINESIVFVIIRCYILTIYELLSRNRSKVEIYSKHICTSNAIHMSKQIDDFSKSSVHFLVLKIEFFFLLILLLHCQGQLFSR